MTYRALKFVTQGLLTGDNSLPKEDDILKALLGMAYNHICNKCHVLNLMTLDKSEEVLRLSQGDYVLRKPALPESDTDELDIDDDLGYVAASLIASYLTKEKVAIHFARAKDGINDYNAKVTEALEAIRYEQQG